MNRLTLRITIGLLIAAVVATVGMQLFISWELNRAISAGRIDQACIDTAGMSPEDSNRLWAALEQTGIPATAPRRPGAASATQTCFDTAGMSPEASKRLQAALEQVGIPAAAPGRPGPERAAPTFVRRPVKVSIRNPLSWTSALVLLAGVVAFVMGAGFILTRPVLKRLQLLDAAAGRIAAGELGARAPVSGNDPITQFTQRFNQMADRNQRLLEGQRHLLQAVSHELRTPAARIRFGLEMMRETDDDEARERYRTGIDADVDEIDALVEELLALNRLDNAGGAIEGQSIDAIAMVHEECAMLTPLRPGIEMVLPPVDDEQILVHGSERLFRRVVRNLLSNALRHARQRVVVTVSRHGDETRLYVDDDGPGVPAADRARIFEPFTRLDGSRSRESGGFGLGLTIVDRIVRTHGGSLVVEDAPGGGARFSLTWPSGREDTDRHHQAADA